MAKPILPLLLVVFIHPMVYSASAAAENIALNQPSWQSGVSSYSALTLAATADKAFDGDPTPVMANGSCSHTARGNNPWLAVDLGSSRMVYRLDITNKVHRPDWLTQIRMGTSDTSPEIVTPALTNFDVCHSYDGAVGAGETKSFYCGSTGRYLIIQLEKLNQVLSVCEVVVFAERFVMNFEATSGKRLDGHGLGLPIVNISPLLCGQKCVRAQACTSYNYKPTTRTCELLSSTFDEETTSLVPDIAWTWYGRRSLY